MAIIFIKKNHLTDLILIKSQIMKWTFFTKMNSFFLHVNPMFFLLNNQLRTYNLYQQKKKNPSFDHKNEQLFLHVNPKLLGE